jgi:nucleotide-sensitive chloride channel 1A
MLGIPGKCDKIRAPAWTPPKMSTRRSVPSVYLRLRPNNDIGQSNRSNTYKTTLFKMPPTIIRSPPSASDYTPLSEYQSQTPETFHGGKPVLHYHATGVVARVYRSQCDSLAFFSNPSPLSFPEASIDNPDEKCEQLVDLFINSEYVSGAREPCLLCLMLTIGHRNFTVYSPKASCGLSLPYPTITLHAIKKVQNTAVEGEEFPSVYLQLELSDGGADDES